MKRVSIIGAGTWGTALAITLSRKGHAATLWAYEPEVVESIRLRHENELYLPGMKIPLGVSASASPAEAVEGAEIVLFVTPSHVLRSLMAGFLPHLKQEMVFVSATKGIDTEQLMRMSEVILTSVRPRFEPGLCVLSGPSFAREVALGDPTAVVVASENRELAAVVQREFSCATFRLYTSTDVVGVEMGGAVKNVIAIAAGIVDGLGLGLNTRAALITRGMTEIRRLGKRMGANPRTFSGLAGYGDLILTCTGELSRNHTVGRELAAGRRLSDVLESMRMVAEGVRTAQSVYQLSSRLGVEMPISRQTYRILYEGLPPREALHELMTRDLRPELDEE